jgi:SAM-dependent methyltransferase
MPFVSTRTWQFTYFANQLGDFDWRDKDVLDFGGNIGNILRDPNSTINVDRYWCIDVDDAAIERGRKSYPAAHWLRYDRFCFFFNPHGLPNLKLPLLEQRFDYIVAYSVFTNTSSADMLELVGELKGLLKRDGKLAFTFIDPHYRSWPERHDWSNLRWRLEKIKLEENPNVDIEGIASAAKDACRCILINGRDLYVDTDAIESYEPAQQRSLYIFHTEGYMQTLFPTATIRPPTNNEMQHCCILSAG